MIISSSGNAGLQALIAEGVRSAGTWHLVWDDEVGEAGNRIASWSLTLERKPPPEKPPPATAERIASVNRVTLPEVTRAMVSSRVVAISDRIEAATSGAAQAAPAMNLTGQSTLYHALRSNAEAIEMGTLDLTQVLGASSFVLPLNAVDEGTGGVGAVAVWASGDYRDLSGGERSAVEYDGQVVSAHLGVDARVRADVLAGVSVSHAKGEFDYTDRSDGEPASGTYESRLTSVHPYVGWSSEGRGLWATVGYGTGEVEFDDEQAEGAQSSDMTMGAAAAGVSGRLLSDDALIAGGTTTLRLKGEGLLAQGGFVL